MRWQFLHRHSQNPIFTHRRYTIPIRILRQHKLPHQLPHPPFHPNILRPFFLFLSHPLSAYQQHILFLHLHLYIPRFQPRHVDNEHVRLRVLFDVRRCRRHGFGVSYVGPRCGVGVVLVITVFVEVHHVVEGMEQWGIETHDSEIHCFGQEW
ncbi:hypothetical protein ES288_D07G022500v1 [Gossypium darwinii]|uniref:Uncharacterized protein n=1 Tax=Gossypium darwinii TaxID=34276 RepID=A0A5D2BUU9_GOSDA|nr:hypothetical protein ES288_D07G022500v1 [Gossypium darwinii]